MIHPKKERGREGKVRVDKGGREGCMRVDKGREGYIYLYTDDFISYQRLKENTHL